MMAIRLGTEMAVRGFNIFAIGANGAHIQGSVRALLEDAASRRPRPSDWVYVNNFATPAPAGGDRTADRPRAGAGQGARST